MSSHMGRAVPTATPTIQSRDTRVTSRSSTSGASQHSRGTNASKALHHIIETTLSVWCASSYVMPVLKLNMIGTDMYFINDVITGSWKNSDEISWRHEP